MKKEHSSHKYHGILVMNFIVIVIFLALAWWFTFRFQKNTPTHTSIDSLSFFLNGDFDTVRINDILNFKVWIANKRKEKMKFNIKDFTVTITTLTSKKKYYDFRYPYTIESSLTAFSKALVFDSTKEGIRVPTEVGTYTLVIKAKVNERQCRLVKFFNAKKVEKIITLPRNDFYIVNQPISFQVKFSNYTSNVKHLVSINAVCLLWKENELISMDHILPSPSFDIFPGNTQSLFSYPEDFSSVTLIPKEAGLYKVEVRLTDANGEHFNATHLIDVIKKESLSNGKNISIYTDIMKFIKAGSKLSFRVYIENRTSNVKRVKFSSFVLSVMMGNKKIYEYTNADTFFVKINPHGSRMILDSRDIDSLVIQHKGDYTVYISADCGGRDLRYSIDLKSF